MILLVMVGSTNATSASDLRVQHGEPAYLEVYQDCFSCCREFPFQDGRHSVRKYETNMRPMPQPVMLGPRVAKATRAGHGLERVERSLSRLTICVSQKMMNDFVASGAVHAHNFVEVARQ